MRITEIVPPNKETVMKFNDGETIPLSTEFYYAIVKRTSNFRPEVGVIMKYENGYKPFAVDGLTRANSWPALSGDSLEGCLRKVVDNKDFEVHVLFCKLEFVEWLKNNV